MTTDAAEDGRYFAADAEADDELARLRLIEDVFDPQTFRYLDAIGVGTAIVPTRRPDQRGGRRKMPFERS